jgi:hypothetical protein
VRAILDIIIFLLVALPCWGQRSQEFTYWIPEKYVYGLASNGTENEYRKHLRPVQAIAHKNGEWYVETFNGKLQPINRSSMTSAKVIPIGRLSLNLKYFTRAEEDSINQIEFRLNLYTDSLVLEAYKEGHLIDANKYIEKFNHYQFDELRKTRKVLLLQGEYNVFNSRGEEIESNVKILASGQIAGSDLMDSCAVSRVGVPDKFIYDQVEFYLHGRLVKSLAMHYDANEKTWMAYDYSVADGKYVISTLSKVAFRLQKK